jgi:hypothetical protein
MIRKIFNTLAMVFVLGSAAPAAADSLLHIWSCQLADDQAPEDAIRVSSDWLKAASGMPGGKGLKVSLEFPVAANSGDGSFNFVLTVPDAKTWGIFMNDYRGSKAEEADDKWSEVATCSGSAIWNSVDVK